DAVLLARSDGVVLHQEGLDMGAVADLTELPAADAPSQARAKETDSSKSENEKSREEGVEEVATAARRRLSASAPETVTFLGDRYLLFCQPINLSLYVADRESGSPKKESGLAVCGLRREARFSAEIRQLPPLGLAAVAGGFVLVMLAWPLLKLRFVGPRE